MRASLVARLTSLSVLGALLGACGGDSSTAPSVTLGIPFHFCSSNPIWMAYQDDAGAWTRSVPDGSGLYHAAINNRGGIAVVRRVPSTGGYSIYVEYATAAEFTAEYGTCNRLFPAGTKSVQGTVAGLGASEFAEITMGGANTASLTNFTMTGAPDGAMDLVAARLPNQAGVWGPPTAMIIRRGLNPVSGSTLATLDFSGAEAFSAAPFNLTVGNLGTDAVSVTVSFLTGTGTYATLMQDTAIAAATQPYVGVPSTQLVSGDLHDVQLVAGTAQSARFYETFAHALSDQTMTLGPELTAPTVTIVDSATNVRPRMQMTIQPEYNSLIEIDYFQCESGLCADGSRQLTMVTSVAYAGAGAASWDMTAPDFSKVNGFSALWGLQPGGGAVSWDADGFGGATNTQLSAQPFDGMTLRDAARVGTAPSALVASSARVPSGGFRARRFRY